MGNNKSTMKPEFDYEDIAAFLCLICDQPVSQATCCPRGCLFCVECVGAYADLMFLVSAERAGDTTVLTSDHRGFVNATPSKDERFSVRVGTISLEVFQHFISLSREHDFHKLDVPRLLTDVLQRPDNRCAACGADGAYSKQRAIDRNLKRLCATCPSPNCHWSGPLAKFRAHLNEKHAATALREDEEQDEIYRKVRLNGKVFKIKKERDGERRRVQLELNYSV